MRIQVTTDTGRFVYDEVEMIIADETEICIWQPNIRNKGSRRTKLDRTKVTSIAIEGLKPAQDTFDKQTNNQLGDNWIPHEENKDWKIQQTGKMDRKRIKG